MIDSARIAKNTIFLYLRMILVLVANFLAVRVLLEVFGAKDRMSGAKEERCRAKEDSVFLRVLSNGELSAKVISERLSVKPTTRSFRKQLNRLLTDGLLQMGNPESPHSRHQKYRLTDEAWTLLAPQLSTLN